MKQIQSFNGNKGIDSSQKASNVGFPSHLTKIEESLEQQSNSLLNISCINFKSLSPNPLPPCLKPKLSKFSQLELGNIHQINDPQHNSSSMRLVITCFYTKEINPTWFHNNLLPKIQSQDFFSSLQEQNVNDEDIDFWLIFTKIKITTPPETFMNILKNQFESVNIVKIIKGFYLDKKNEDEWMITGWKLFDKYVAEEIIRKSKNLLLFLDNKQLEYDLISSSEELRKHIRKLELDKRLGRADLFNNEIASPLFKLHVQGLFYYEFDYADICPETLCILCGIPEGMIDSQLIEHLREISLPGNFFPLSLLIKQEPINILRNSSESKTCIRLSFSSKDDADLFRFQGLKLPIEGPFKFKPIIILSVKDRESDYFSELKKYQVMIQFEGNEEYAVEDQIKVLKEIQTYYGLISDINVMCSQRWIISFLTIEATMKCLDHARFDNFSLNISITKSTNSYMPSGFLFQSTISFLHDNHIPKRPPPLIRVEPSQLKIKSKYFEINLSLKRRYQKIYLSQQENIRNEASLAKTSTSEEKPLNKEKIDSHFQKKVLSKPEATQNLVPIKSNSTIPINETLLLEKNSKKYKKKSSSGANQISIKEKILSSSTLNKKRELELADTSIEEPNIKILATIVEIPIELEQSSKKDCSINEKVNSIPIEEEKSVPEKPIGRVEEEISFSEIASQLSSNLKVCPEEFSVEPPSNTLQLNDKNSGFNQEDNSNEFNCYKLKKKEEKNTKKEMAEKKAISELKKEKTNETLTLNSQDIEVCDIEIEEAIEENFGSKVEIFIPKIQQDYSLSRKFIKVKNVQEPMKLDVIVKKEVKEKKIDNIDKSLRKESQKMILENIKKIQNLIESHEDIRRRKKLEKEDIKVKVEDIVMEREKKQFSDSQRLQSLGRKSR